MKEKDILYKVIIYRDVNKIEIYKKTEELIEDKYCTSEKDIYNTIIQKTKDCKDINQIEIIYK